MHGEVTGGNGRGKWTVTWRRGPFTLISWPDDEVEAVDSEVEVLRAGLGKARNMVGLYADGAATEHDLRCQLEELAEILDQVETAADLAPSDADGLSGWR